MPSMRAPSSTRNRARSCTCGSPAAFITTVRPGAVTAAIRAFSVAVTEASSRKMSAPLEAGVAQPVVAVDQALGAERAERQQVGVHPAPADEVAAGERQLHLAAARQQRARQQERCPQAAAEVGVEVVVRTRSARSAREFGPSSRTLTPRSSRRASITCTSRMSGTLSSTTSSSVRRHAARIGRAAFLSPLGTMVPDSARPPRMTSLSWLTSPEASRRATAGRPRPGGPDRPRP